MIAVPKRGDQKVCEAERCKRFTRPNTASSAWLLAPDLHGFRQLMLIDFPLIFASFWSISAFYESLTVKCIRTTGTARFNRTAGIMRRSMIEDAGGWQHGTLTEDLRTAVNAASRNGASSTRCRLLEVFTLRNSLAQP